MVRETAIKTTDIIGTTAADLWWRVETNSVFYEDDGTEYLRITHLLKANIMATDIVLFELSYRPGSAGSATDVNSIGEDFARCQLSRGTTDTRFWTAQLSEGYYRCTGSTPANVCDGLSYASEVSEATGNDWRSPYIDNN